MKKSEAIRAIQHHGVLLVFPIQNRKEPKSLWSVFYPRTPMRWEWDEEGDDRVARLWHLREELSRSRKVVYSKWYRGRATFFSLPVFQALLAIRLKNQRPLSRDARDILSILEERSPLSTKQLKRATGLVGRDLEAQYNRALRELWQQLLIVAYGEVEEGAFPSLAIGATRLIFEDLYLEAEKMPQNKAWEIASKAIESSPLISKFYHQAEV